MAEEKERGGVNDPEENKGGEDMIPETGGGETPSKIMKTKK